MADLSPYEWLVRLDAALTARWVRRMAAFDAYFEGDHELAFATAKWREAFGSQFSVVPDNWCPLVVESTAERIDVQGFRYKGPDAAATSDAAWSIWQENGLDSEAEMAHTEAIKLGEAYWLVEPPLRPGDLPRVTSEHPSQVIVQCAAGDRRTRLAALKRWVDELDGHVYATVYLPDVVVKYRSQDPAKYGQDVKWELRPADPGGPNPLGVVPVVPLRNAPTMRGGGQSDLKDCIPIQDALNKLLSDMLISSEYIAFPQRVLLGQSRPVNPQTGQPMTAAEMKAAGMDLDFSQARLAWFESPDAKVAQWDAADLKTYVESRQHLVRGLTAKTRTPPHYVLGEIVNASGDALVAAETGLVSKTRRKLKPFGEGHEEMIRLCFLAQGDVQRAAVRDAETVWGNIEARSEAQMVDAATKLMQVGLPNEFVWSRYLNMSPQEIARWRGAAAANDLLAAVTAQTAQTTQPVPPAVPPAAVGANGAVGA
jgi:hypothetical protein